MKKSKLVVMGLMLALAFTSCEKNNDADLMETEDLSITEAVSLEASIEGVEDVTDQYILYSGAFLQYDGIASKGDPRHFGFFRECAIIESVITDTSYVINITFEEECEDKHGNTVSGVITITKEISDTSKERTITFVDFTVNGYVVNGAKTFNYTAENANGNPEMSGTVDISIETEEGTISKVGNRTIEITAGAETDSWLDDEITKTASFSYTRASGAMFTMEITTPLVKPAECKYFASGVREFTNDEGTSSLDYGDSTCDNIAVLTDSDGNETEIELRKGRRKKKH
ncbi:MAG: hypothetical protein COA50_10065 [Flavobacteriaceae bacterium]|nr:MAG: hypothetical protein COA50_10065 [Flavobacteriaceae bacterium]